MSTIQNLVVNQGASFSFEFSLSNADGSPRDLTDKEIRAQMRKAYASRISTPFTVTTPDVENGTIRLSFTPEQTLMIRDGRYVYDVIVEDLDDEDPRVLEGIVTVTPGVTREDAPEPAPLDPSHPPLSINQILGGIG